MIIFDPARADLQSVLVISSNNSIDLLFLLMTTKYKAIYLDYADMDSLLDVVVISPEVKTY